MILITKIKCILIQSIKLQKPLLLLLYQYQSSMSSVTPVHFENAQSYKKPYCKVCQDAGKPESEYTNHYVRSLPDRNGKTIVTCPTLNSTACRCCNKMGHTTKFCPEIKNNRKEYKRDEYAATKVYDATKGLLHNKTATKPSTIYNVLMESDEEDIRKPTEKPVATEKSVATVSWANIAAKPMEEKIIPVSEVKTETIVKYKPYIKSSIKLPVTTQNQNKSWADWTDSDDDNNDDQHQMDLWERDVDEDYDY
jgi:hypothetical protein